MSTDCCNHNCRQGRDCPARTPKPTQSKGKAMEARANNMDGLQRAELILKHHIRASTIIDLACATFTYDIDLKGDELLDDLLAPVVDLHPSMLPLRQELECLSEDEQNDISECLAALWASGFSGYAVQFHAPCGNNTDHPNFGTFRAQWIYAETIEEAWQMASVWGDECRQQLQLELESEA